MRIATICARSGSKGVPSKNLLKIKDKSLLEITVTQARKSKMFDCIAVSSDDPVLLENSTLLGVDFIVERPKILSGDYVSKPETIKHLVGEVEISTAKKFTTVVDLDITAPLRYPNDIKNAIILLESGGLHSVLSGGPSRRNPHFNIVKYGNSGNLELANNSEYPFIARQDAPNCYDLNASINVWNRDALFDDPKILLGKTKLYELKIDQVFDIDTKFDVELIEFLYSRMTQRFINE
jgi:CMP-N,N'-diacetyllegionaminic acid synthase